jgi:hypothetical protein
MEQSIKLIKIQHPNKKQLYKDILSSSKKVQEIIKKTKINKSKFYKQKDNKNIVDEKPFPLPPPSYPINNHINNQHVNHHINNHHINNQHVNHHINNQYVPKDPIKELENIVDEKPFPLPPPSYPINNHINNQPVNHHINNHHINNQHINNQHINNHHINNHHINNQPINNQYVPKDPIKELENIVYEKPLHNKSSIISKKTWINNNYFKHEERQIEKKTCKNIIAGKYKSNKIKNYKQPNVLNYYNNSKKITMKIFTHKEIDKFINVLYYYSEYEQHVKIHKYIKKLNKYQTLQILYEINLIKSKSKAPLSMLKNILYNYFCCNINIIR